MATSIRQINLLIDCPIRLNDRAIEETVALCASRVRFLLNSTYRQMLVDRIEARQAGKLRPPKDREP